MAAQSVAEFAELEARRTFEEIKRLRRESPTRTAAQRKALEEAINADKEEWWERVGPAFAVAREEGQRKFWNDVHTAQQKLAGKVPDEQGFVQGVETV
jgi:hypothetical protein